MREAGSTAAESLVELDQVCTPQIWRGWWQLVRRIARGVLNLCVQALKARNQRFLRENIISDHGLVSSYEVQQGARKGQYSWSVIEDLHRVLDGSMLACALASPVQGLHYHGPQK